MSLNYQILFYVAVGLFLYFVYWRLKGIISSVLNVLNYFGIGLLFYGIATANDLYSYLGGAVMLLSVIAFFIMEKNS